MKFPSGQTLVGEQNTKSLLTLMDEGRKHVLLIAASDVTPAFPGKQHQSSTKVELTRLAEWRTVFLRRGLTPLFLVGPKQY